MVTLASQVAAPVAVFVALAACDSPARVKPWRHAPDPIAEAANAPRSPALAEGPAESEIRASRPHTLRIHVDSDPGRINPLVNPSVWARRITHGTVFEPLLRYVPPDAGQPAGRYLPRLARSWRVVVPPWGGLEIRIELEPNVRFHDGRPLTSGDVQFTLDAIRDPRRGVDHLRPMLEDVEAVELITATEVRLVLKKPSGYVLRALAEIPILPMHVYDGSLAASALVGSGPWKVAANKGGVVQLARHDRYWGAKVAIPNIEFVYQPDAAAALKDAKRNPAELDIIPALIPAHWPEQASSPGVAAFAPLALSPPRLRYLAFNTEKAPLEDPRVRHALALVIDRKEISERYFDRLARPALWPVWPGGLVHGAELAVPQFDPKAAGALLDAAGWIDSDKDGIRDRNGEQLRVVMIGGEKSAPKDPASPVMQWPRDYVIDAARRVGMVIELKTGGDAWVQKRIDEGSYHVVELQWSGMVDSDVRRRFGSPAKLPTGITERIPTEIDRVLDQMASVWTPAERAKLAGSLAAALANTWPIAGIVTDAPQGLVHRRVKGVKIWDGWIDLTALSLDEKR